MFAFIRSLFHRTDERLLAAQVATEQSVERLHKTLKDGHDHALDLLQQTRRDLRKANRVIRIAGESLSTLRKGEEKGRPDDDR